MVRSFALALAFASGCGTPALSCGEGEDPVVVTGLSGTIDGTPSIEIQLRVPMDCEVRDVRWTFWDEANDVATVGDPPTEGVLERDGIEAGDRTIVFRDLGLAVRLEYPGEEPAPELALVWFASGEDLAAVDCTSDPETLLCEVRP